MGKRTQIITREYLKQVPLPTHASSYTLIEHETVVVNVLEQLKLKGFEVEKERYRSNNGGEVACGVYNLRYKNDPELGMMFAWANSYDKSMRFKCAVGGFVRVSDSCVVSADFSWGRKHTGTADSEMIAQVTNQIANGQIYYDELVAVKEEMKGMTMYPMRIYEFLGRAFFSGGLFSKEQIGIVKDELQKPSYLYNAPSNSLWTYYNHMLLALKKAHPRTWLDEQRELHKYVVQEFGLKASGAISQIPANPVAAPQAPVVELIVTQASTTEEPVVITVEPTPGPVHVFETESKDPIEELGLEDKKLREFAEDMYEAERSDAIRDHDDGLTGDDISAEEQALIDARIAGLNSIQVDKPSFNLPD